MSDKEIINIEPEHRLGIIPAKTPHDVIVQATSIAKELAKIVKENRLSRNIQGREYVYVEGWSTMGAMLGVLPREVSSIRLEDGSYEAVVELIRITDNAIIGRASAVVGMDEKDRNGKMTWGSRPEYARKSMSITRATGKAYRLGFSWIMGLAGYAPTPAEEMDGIVDAEYREAPPPPKQDNSNPVPVKTVEYNTVPYTRPYSPQVLMARLDEFAKGYVEKGWNANDKQRGLAASMLSTCFDGEDNKRYAVTGYITGGVATSMSDVSNEYVLAILDWLGCEKDDTGQYMVGEHVPDEANRLLSEAMKEQGQQDLL